MRVIRAEILLTFEDGKQQTLPMAAADLDTMIAPTGPGRLRAVHGLDIRDGLVYVGNQPLLLPPLQYRLLYTLYRAQGALVEWRVLDEALYGDVAFGTQARDALLRRVRQKLQLTDVDCAIRVERGRGVYLAKRSRRENHAHR